MERLTGIISGRSSLHGELSAQGVGLSGGLSVQGLPYGGAYTFTPSSEAQTVMIAGKLATQDIVINPIPNNYGLVEWNGAYLHIS